MQLLSNSHRPRLRFTWYLDTKWEFEKEKPSQRGKIFHSYSPRFNRSDFSQIKGVEYSEWTINHFFETRRAVGEPLLWARAIWKIEFSGSSKESLIPVLPFVQKFGLVADQTGLHAVRTTRARHYHSECHSWPMTS